MINFIVYNYSFPKPDSEDLFNAIYKDDETLNSELIEKLKEASKSDGGINLYFEQAKGRDGESEIKNYPNVIEANSKGVFLIQLHTYRPKKVTPANGTEKVSVDNYPWCWLVIDTRPGSHLILIQKKSEAFSKNTDFVADYLIGDFCQRELGLSMNGTSLHLEKRLCEGKLWELIKLRTKVGGEKLKSLCLKLAERNEPEGTNHNEVDRALQFVLRSMNSPEGELKLYSQTDTDSILMGRKPDFIGIAEVLLNYNYTIRAEFAKSGSYECGKDTEVIYGAIDAYVEKFGELDESGAEMPETFALIRWLDETILQDNTYYYSDCLQNYGRAKRKTKASA